MPSLKITQQDIADALNISRATVSKVFNNKPLPEKVRSEVLKKAEELGYSTAKAGPPAVLGTVPARLSGLILLICFPGGDAPRQPVYAMGGADRWRRMIVGMETACGRFGYHLLVTVLSGNDESAVQLLEQYTLSKVEGAVLCGDGGKIDRFLTEHFSKSPTVVADADASCCLSFAGHDVIGCDVMGAMAEIVRHFARAGHRRIAFVGEASGERRLGWMHGCMESKVEADDGFLFEPAAGPWQERFERKLGAGEGLPTAFVCESDAVALEVKAMLERKGLRVPGDCCVSGFDCTDDETPESGVTTSLFHREYLGQRAAELLISRIGSPNAPCVSIRQRVQVVFQCPLPAQARGAAHAGALKLKDDPVPAE